MSDELSGILKFLNSSFGKFKTLNQISELNDAEYIDKILRDAENNFFQDMNYLPSDSEINNQYNMRIIFNRISAYYQYVVKKPLNDNFFDYKDTSDENMLKLGELLIGICAKSRKQEYFEVFDDLPEKESNEIFRVLSELIPLEEEKEANKSKSQDGIKEKNEEWIHLMEEVEDLRNENAMLWIRAENAEKENERLNHEMNELTEKVTELTKSNYTLELNLKETEAKYQELVSSLERKETEIIKRRGSDFNLSIEISELKGKLEAKTKSFYEYQEEKEKLIDELNNKLNTLRKENIALKEIKVKYDVLQNELKKLSFENMSSIKQRLAQCERLIKEKDEEINRLSNSENQKILLKKIEELNKQNSLKEEELNQLREENENITQQLAVKDCEITQLKENFGVKEDKQKDAINTDKDGDTLGNLIEQENKGRKGEEFFELEKKVAELEKEKSELNYKIKLLEENLKKEKEENEKINQNNINTILDENKDKSEKINKLEKQINEIENEKKNLKDKIEDL